MEIQHFEEAAYFDQDRGDRPNKTQGLGNAMGETPNKGHECWQRQGQTNTRSGFGNARGEKKIKHNGSARGETSNETQGLGNAMGENLIPHKALAMPGSRNHTNSKQQTPITTTVTTTH